MSAVILAAGESRRFGSPKALVEIDGKPIIARQQELLLHCGLDEVVVVLGAHLQSIEPHVFNHSTVRIVYNKDYKLGQTSSFQCGIIAASENTEGFLLLPVDYPFIRPDTIKQLMDDFSRNHSAILLPQFEGHRGHPPIFSSTLKHELLMLSLEHGINELFKKYAPVFLNVNDPGVVQTFNTPEELRDIRASSG